VARGFWPCKNSIGIGRDREQFAKFFWRLSHDFDMMINLIIIPMGSRKIPSLFPICVAFSIDLVFSLLYASVEFSTTYFIDFRCFCHTPAFAI
jgi:hypothetical protein